MDLDKMCADIRAAIFAAADAGHAIVDLDGHDGCFFYDPDQSIVPPFERS